MPRKKSNKIIETFKIFFSSIKTYFLYLDKTMKMLAFPVLGQLISLILIFTATYYFNQNIDSIRSINKFFDSDTNILIIFLVILLPLFIVFIKAFYDFIIAFSSLNIMFYTVSGKKKVKDVDFKSINGVIERNLLNYILLMFLVTLIFILPPFCFIAIITGIFLCLCFQVFALEGEKSAIQSIKRSCELVKSNIFPTIIMLLLCFFTTYQFLPELFNWAFDKAGWSFFLVTTWEPFFKLFPLDNYNTVIDTLKSISPLFSNLSLDSVTITKIVVEGMISAIVIMFTLPFRCCCFTELYKLFDADKIKEYSKESEEIIKRATNKKERTE
ncbi:hypothetical protein II906_05860 [bacterium]|nr:hypothetical protein [bacterium]